MTFRRQHCPGGDPSEPAPKGPTKASPNDAPPATPNADLEAIFCVSPEPLTGAPIGEPNADSGAVLLLHRGGGSRRSVAPMTRFGDGRLIDRHFLCAH
jgi:hypothetical protein